MKKLLRTVILSAICCSLLIMSGCDSKTGTDTSSGSNAGFDYVPIEAVRDGFSQAVEELKALEFDNLDFSNTEFSFPEIDSISKLELPNFTGKSAQELYDFFSASLEKFMPGKFSEEEKLNEIFFYNERNPDGTHQTIKDYDSDSINPMLGFENEDGFLDMYWGVLRWFDNDDLKHWDGEEGKPIMEMLNNGSRPIDDYITDLNSEKKYELINGEISVKDAVEFANNFLQTTNFSPYELPTKSRVVEAVVVDIGKGKFGYDFITTPEYKNVLFDYVEVNEDVGGHSYIENSYDSRRYDTAPHHICMIETDKVYNFIIPAYSRNIKETETYTSIISLKDAAEIVNNFYSESMNFSVGRVQPVYRPYLNTAEPCWKFTLNLNGCCYNTFVNMHTGEVYVYIQA